MKFTLILVVAVLALWLVLSPPLFTDGACTAEFDAESAKLEASAQSIRSSKAVAEYFTSRAVAYQVITTEQCRKAKPRFLSRCGDGPLVVAKVPVKNGVCRIYRDSEISVRLQYDDRDRLSRMVLDMSPYKSLPIPFTDVVIHWGR